VIIGKVSINEKLNIVSENSLYKIPAKDTSVTIKNQDAGVVDAVILTLNSDNDVLVKVKLRCIRIPQIGDKFASRHGQKGTIGMA